MKSPMRISFDGDATEVVISLHACGWGYANSGCKLHATASRCGVPRICDFFAPKGTSESPWFPIEDGLASIRGLRAELRHSPGSVCDADCSERDLAEIERVLSATPAGRFRLEIVRKGPSGADVASAQIESPRTPAQRRS
jgi:hypothetical protein